MIRTSGHQSTTSSTGTNLWIISSSSCRCVDTTSFKVEGYISSLDFFFFFKQQQKTKLHNQFGKNVNINMYFRFNIKKNNASILTLLMQDKFVLPASFNSIISFCRHYRWINSIYYVISLKMLLVALQAFVFLWPTVFHGVVIDLTELYCKSLFPQKPCIPKVCAVWLYCRAV